MRLFFLIPLFLSACAQPTTRPPVISPQELAAEQATQDRLMREAEAQGGVPRNWRGKPGMKKQFERVAERIEKAGAEVCRGMGLPQQKRRCYYYFQLSTDREVNASADGDAVTINYGMLRFIENDDELAGVMGHELAHNLLDHIGAKRDNATMGAVFGALLDVAAAAEGVNTRGDFTDVGGYAGSLGYSPAFESEADYVGLYITARAGYNPRKVAPYWRRLSVAYPESSRGGVTHPGNPERFVGIQKTADEIEAKKRAKKPLLPEMHSERR